MLTYIAIFVVVETTYFNVTAMFVNLPFNEAVL